MYGSGFTVALSGELSPTPGGPTVTADTETPIETPPAEPSALICERGLLLAFAGVAAAGVCCGLPILGSLGVAGVVVGAGTGSWLIAAAASITAVIGMVRWRRRRSCHSTTGTSSERAVLPVADGESLRHHEVLR
jgi:hypothetical protein